MQHSPMASEGGRISHTAHEAQQAADTLDFGRPSIIRRYCRVEQTRFKPNSRRRCGNACISQRTQIQNTQRTPTSTLYLYKYWLLQANKEKRERQIKMGRGTKPLNRDYRKAVLTILCWVRYQGTRHMSGDRNFAKLKVLGENSACHTTQR